MFEKKIWLQGSLLGSALSAGITNVQITRGADDEYIVSFEGCTFVIPADKALPSNDRCSHIFFENVWAIAGGNQVRFPGTPGVYCFLTPLDF